MHNLRVTVAGMAFIFLASCDFVTKSKEDSWEHYQNGGLFQTKTPAISPDHKLLVYATPCTGHGDIYKVEQGGMPTQLTKSDDFESSPMLTPTGDRIIYVRESAGRRHIWMMDLDGDHVVQLTHGETLDDAQWISSDGRFLIFTRVPATRGSGKIVTSYLLRLDAREEMAIRVGEIAVFSPDSGYVIYSEANSLWRLDLDDEQESRQRIFGSGLPLAVSKDGQSLLTSRLKVEEAYNVDHQIWIVDTKTEMETHVANGHSAIFLGAHSEYILYLMGFNQQVFIKTLDGDALELQCDATYKTHPRIVADGRGILLGSFSKTSTPDYEVLFVDTVRRKVSIVASLSCEHVSFSGIPPIEGETMSGTASGGNP